MAEGSEKPSEEAKAAGTEGKPPGSTEGSTLKERQAAPKPSATNNPDDVIASFKQKEKARRRARQKRTQMNFLFKAGAFLVMLTIVMITKKVQEWYKPDGAKQGSTPKVTPSPIETPVEDTAKSDEL
eukprot:TRINITY_DN108742_c0_g1_i1.p1 TRINITY_DN108742_c0_g1~~TRINITY_DN108742_c0_g1_i1.p1  ORF type:complete len:127 (+),score=29.01 TRINITY_DN108742_c0_g1_i1:35-415(+)